MAESYKDLRVYKLAYELGLEIHSLTMAFPKFELYELGSQMRRCSKSVPANIAEGYGRSHYGADFIRFLVFALASSDEIAVHLQYALDLGYISEEIYASLADRYDHVGKMLYRLVDSLDTRSRVAGDIRDSRLKRETQNARLET